MLPQMIGYVKCFDNNKTMSFKIANYNLLKNIYKNRGKSMQLNEYRI